MFVLLQSEVNVTFSTPNYVVAEGAIVTVTLRCNVEIQRSFEVKVTTVDGTAKGEGEFPCFHTSSALSSALVVCACVFLSLLTSWDRLHGPQQFCGDL